MRTNENDSGDIFGVLKSPFLKSENKETKTGLKRK
jgi:hypothetical protein